MANQEFISDETLDISLKAFIILGPCYLNGWGYMELRHCQWNNVR